MDEKSEEEDLANMGEQNDSDVIAECEKELQEMLEWDNLGTQTSEHDISRNKVVEKRIREESDMSNEDDFTTVSRRRTKRLLRSDSTNNTIKSGMDDKSDSEGKTEVCVTSQQLLPKQIAFAKLLKAEKIENVLRIKYKSPYKALIQVKNKEQAEKILKSPKFDELGFRRQLTLVTNLSYGVVKGVDLDMEDKEILEVFKSRYEIMTINRLKRLNYDGKWIKSETVRFCFNNPTPPAYVFAYEARFKVERYVFPVTQCSGCWKFGHLIKYCPSKQLTCPKCGQNHANCEITNIKCLNCKGDHIVLDKSCPIFIKEKNIRNIMSEQNVTYRKALQIYLNKEEKKDNTTHLTNELRGLQSPVLPVNPPLNKRTYSSVTSTGITKPIVHAEDLDSDRNEERSYGSTSQRSEMNKKGSKKKNKKQMCETQEKNDENLEECFENQETQNKEEESEKVQLKRKRGKFELKKLLLKLKEIALSSMEFEEKISSVFSLFYNEFKVFILNLITGSDIIQFVMQLFYG